MQFLIPKEPRLHWAMIYPKRRDWAVFPSFFGKPTYFFFWARNAIYHGLSAMEVSPGDTILVPSFHCAMAIEPILRYGANVKFYNIHRDCSPDFEDLCRKIDKKTRAVLAIHYFGFPCPIKTFKKVCEEHALYLIEDCAHVLSGGIEGDPLGTFGDISIFSWRKLLPIYDGGHLVINNPKLHIDVPWERSGLLLNLKVAKNLVEKLLDSSSTRSSKTLLQYCRFPNVLKKDCFFLGKDSSRAFTINNSSLDFDPSFVNLRISVISKYLMANMNISAIIEKRRQNYVLLLKAVDSFPEITPFFPHLSSDTCPWIFPLIMQGQKGFHTILRSKGIPAVTWDGVIHPNLPLEEYPEAAFLYQNLIFLPVHQSIGEREIGTLIEIIKTVFLHGD